MKWKLIPLLLLVCVLLSGCGLFDGEYLSVTPHREQSVGSDQEAVSAEDYEELVAVLEDMVTAGTESSIINITNYDQALVERNMQSAVHHIRQVYPIGAYAVKEIEYELGTATGRPAVAVNITYSRTRMEIQKIRRVLRMDNAAAAVTRSLESYDSVLVLQVLEYEEMDFVQLVQNYAENHPETVMETPQVAVGLYGSGDAKVVELTFTYQTSREALRSMQSQVQTVFDSADLYVSGEGLERQKFSQLYGFLMERFEYTLETSITPAYSLLVHGVGDSRAFAMVYASMCRQAGLECMIVTGTRDGEPRTWNIVMDNGSYYHVDLLRSSGQGGYREYVDSDMSGYVWDYSSYPECALPYTPPEETQPQPQASEATLPPETTVPTEST